MNICLSQKRLEVLLRQLKDYFFIIQLTNMQASLNPIEKHKSQIQKRISLLEQKFKEKENPRDNVKKLRDLIQDQNNIVPHHAILNSKTVEVRGKIRNQVDSSKAKKYSIYNQSSIPHQKLNQTELLRNTIETIQPKDSKDQKIGELYDMMRSILEGQKNIEKELNELKKQQLRESNKKIKNQSKATKAVENQAVNESIIQNLSRTREKKIMDKSIKKDVSKNQSFLYQQHQEPKPSKSPNKKLKAKKNCNFDELVSQLRGKEKNGERICVGDEWKGRIWAEVEERVKQSEKQYKDTIHRNNKHQFEHLMSTFQLQRKLKDQLIDKVYSQSNTQLYK